MYGRNEPFICLKCAFSFPFDKSIIKTNEESTVIDLLCPLCGSNQIISVNDLIDKSESLKNYIKMFKIEMRK